MSTQFAELRTEPGEVEEQFCCRSCCGRRCSAKDVRFYVGDFIKFALTFLLTLVIVYYEMGSRIDAKVTAVNLELAKLKLQINDISDQLRQAEVSLVVANNNIVMANITMMKISTQITQLQPVVDQLVDTVAGLNFSTLFQQTQQLRYLVYNASAQVNGLVVAFTNSSNDILGFQKDLTNAINSTTVTLHSWQTMVDNEKNKLMEISSTIINTTEIYIDQALVTRINPQLTNVSRAMPSIYTTPMSFDCGVGRKDSDGCAFVSSWIPPNSQMQFRIDATSMVHITSESSLVPQGCTASWWASLVLDGTTITSGIASSQAGFFTQLATEWNGRLSAGVHNIALMYQPNVACWAKFAYSRQTWPRMTIVVYPNQ